MRLFKVYRMTNTENGVLKGWEKTFKTTEEVAHYIKRQKDLLINYEGLTLSTYCSCMAAFTRNGVLQVTLMIESEYIDETKKYQIKFKIFDTEDRIFCNKYTQDNEYIYCFHDDGTEYFKIPLEDIISITIQ